MLISLVLFAVIIALVLNRTIKNEKVFRVVEIIMGILLLIFGAVIFTNNAQFFVGIFFR